MFLLFLFGLYQAGAQTNILVTNPEAEQILLGDFNPEDYEPAFPVNDPETIANAIANGVSSDSLKSYLEKMAAFGNRNTGSDTTSSTFGIGAARRWAYEKFKTGMNWRAKALGSLDLLYILRFVLMVDRLEDGNLYLDTKFGFKLNRVYISLGYRPELKYAYAELNIAY